MRKHLLGFLLLSTMVSGAIALSDPVALGRCNPNPGRDVGQGRGHCELRCGPCYRLGLPGL